MLKKTFLITLLAVAQLFLSGNRADAQAAYRKGSGEHLVHNVVWPAKLERQIGFLSSDICQGRATGTRGSTEAAFWIAREFKNNGLLPIDGSYCKHFYPGKGLVGHNVIGMMPGSKKSPKDTYVIVCAHFDGLGTIDGTMYPGADSNASGVAAMISMSEMFSIAKTMGRSFNSNIIFVALDAKGISLGGANELWKKIDKGEYHDPLSGKVINSQNVKMLVNIDQIGSSLSPLKSKREDYLIMLGVNSLTQRQKEITGQINTLYGTGLELAYSYYGSDKFTEIFYKKVSDQKPFVEHHKSAVMFTSGITMNNNKTSDTVSSLNLDVLRRRIIFIYH
ncbi:MAG: M28 family peptidase, partial [Bacteroidales bacterium]|nr:M28 family peptidase [Bacteroidales bacterium]